MKRYQIFSLFFIIILVVIYLCNFQRSLVGTYILNYTSFPNGLEKFDTLRIHNQNSYTRTYVDTLGETHVESGKIILEGDPGTILLERYTWNNNQVIKPVPESGIILHIRSNLFGVSLIDEPEEFMALRYVKIN